VRDAPVAASPYRGPVLFIKGGDSDYIREEHRRDILRLFPAAMLRVMPGCGHWLHAQQPSLFNSIVGRFLDGNLER
jgi:esterase